jgi:hypothetical protein
MKPATIIFFLLLLFSNGKAQKDSAFQLYRTIPVKAVDLTVDNLNNMYILTATDQLKKLDVNGDSLAVYNDIKKFGKLYSIDVSNPLKIVLFYKSFSTIVVLDRMLAVKNSIDLRKKGIPQASATAASYDNNLWVFDAVENKLKKLDESGRQLMETPDLRQVFNTVVEPEKIIDENQSVYLYDAKQGIFVFDHYGSFKKKYPLPQWTSVRIKDRQIMGISNNSLLVYNMVNFTQQQYQFPSSFGSFSKYVTGNTKLFTLGKDSLTIYNFRFNLQ